MSTQESAKLALSWFVTWVAKPQKAKYNTSAIAPIHLEQWTAINTIRAIYSRLCGAASSMAATGDTLLNTNKHLLQDPVAHCLLAMSLNKATHLH
jgi:hypothetical protein